MTNVGDRPRQFFRQRRHIVQVVTLLEPPQDAVEAIEDIGGQHCIAVLNIAPSKVGDRKESVLAQIIVRRVERLDEDRDSPSAHRRFGEKARGGYEVTQRMRDFSL